MTMLYKLSSVFFKNQDKTQDYPLTFKVVKIVWLVLWTRVKGQCITKNSTRNNYLHKGEAEDFVVCVCFLRSN